MNFCAVSFVVDIVMWLLFAYLNGADCYTTLQLVVFAFPSNEQLGKFILGGGGGGGGGEVIAINIIVITNKPQIKSEFNRLMVQSC